MTGTKRSLSDSDIATHQRRRGPQGAATGTDADAAGHSPTDHDTAPAARTDHDAAPPADRDG